jgi:hypothetical protein
MISSISGNRFIAQQADFNQKPANASYTASPKQDLPLKTSGTKSPDSSKTEQLSDSDRQLINKLKQTDAEVRAHEAAHLAAAGGIAIGGAHFEYQQGPDGLRYAVSGEVSIDSSPVPGDPAATLRKADIIRRAALAPAHPSGPDMQVAASAAAMAAQAQVELLQKSRYSEDSGQLGTKINLSV